MEGEREVPITEFFLGPRKTVLRKGELLKEIVVPYERGSGASFIKLGRRNAFTLSVVAVALNSVAPRPVRAVSVEKFLKSREVSMSAVEEGAKHVLRDISPISDVRASAEYRKEMSVVLTKESLLRSLERAGVKL